MVAAGPGRDGGLLAGLLQVITSLENVTVQGTGEDRRCKIPARKAINISI
jgi:hypothetical protein